MTTPLDGRLETALEGFRQEGVYKRLNHLESPQGARVRMEGRGEVIIVSMIAPPCAAKAAASRPGIGR